MKKQINFILIRTFFTSIPHIKKYSNIVLKFIDSKLLSTNSSMEPIYNNFDVSIIMPFYKKMKEFRKVFPKNKKYFQRNGIEIILVLDSPEEQEELLYFIEKYPFINWKVIMNDKPHSWRNPAKPLNVGIKHATRKYIMVCSPESEFETDAILQLRTAIKNYANIFAIGSVCFADGNDKAKENYEDKYLPYGSIMVKKKYLLSINGYDETFNKWGGDDDNLRSRLEMYGIKKFFMPEVKLLHREIDNKDQKSRRFFDSTEMTMITRRFHYPGNPIANLNSWGDDFDQVIYDWENKKSNLNEIRNYLNKFDKFALNSGIKDKSYDIILLVQAYNEEKYMTNYLKKITEVVDGIILLDDGSNDNTYELANSDKLLLKVKKERIGFDDLLNRNTLLDLASFYNYKWAVFIDLDELLDDRFYNMREVAKNNSDADSFAFNLIHLWNNENVYNASYPFSKNGLSLKIRMFKNMGYSQIYSDRGKLHFQPIPYIGENTRVPILIKHYGNLTLEMRQKKYNFYKEEDTDQSQKDYEHLLIKEPILNKVSNITLNNLISNN